MTDGETNPYTMGDGGKQSLPKMVTDNSTDIQTNMGRLTEIEDRLNGKKNEPGVDDQINRLFLYFKILWISATIIGTIAGFIFNWLLGKI